MLTEFDSCRILPSHCPMENRCEYKVGKHHILLYLAFASTIFLSLSIGWENLSSSASRTLTRAMSVPTHTRSLAHTPFAFLSRFNIIYSSSELLN